MEDDDDDCSLITEGSQLYNHLKDANFDGPLETIPLEGRKHNQCSKEIITSEEYISPENYELVEKLLYSNLLFEEDASYLFSLVSTLKIRHVWPKWIKVMLPGFIGSCLLLNRKNLIYSVIFGSLSGTFVYFNQLFMRKQKFKKITQILNILNEFFRYTRISIKKAYEMASHIVTLETTRKNDDLISEMFFQRLKEEIDILITSVVVNILDVLSIVRQKCIYLGGKLCESPIQVQLVSNLSDEQLGIDKFYSRSKNGLSLNLNSLEVLKHIYLLIQSEYVKLLGICLTPYIDFSDSDFFKSIDQDLDKFLVVLKKMRVQYHCSFYPKQLNKSQNRNSEKRTDCCEKIKIFNSLLRALSLESDNLEIYLESNNETSEEDVGRSLCHIERKMNDCSSYFKEMSNHYLKSNKTNSAPLTLPKVDLEKLDGKEIHPIEVGYSDFSISDVDKVYLYVNDELESFTEEKSKDVDEIAPQLPLFVLSELKNALTVKKNEFIQRELEAVQRSDIDIEKYNEFLIEANEQVSAKSNTTVNTRKVIQSSENLLNRDLGLSNGFSFQKMIAQKAADTAMGWNSHPDEIIIDGSSEESDGDN